MANQKLNTEEPLRLIGIQILPQTAPQVRKNLRPGWYSFIKCEKNIKTNLNAIPKVSADCPTSYYQINNDLPKVSVSAIVGKNGSGKSTLLDILYRIINNFAETLFLKNNQDETDIVDHVYGLEARLFFEQDGLMKFILCDDKGTSYYNIVGEKPQPVNILRLTDKQRNDILRGFFYTISVNYSLYAFNPLDYRPSLETGNELKDNGGNWLNKLFHKNDGYYIPLVLTPYRKDGNIDVNKENRLALQRLNIMAILFHSQKKEFLAGYEPVELRYVFNTSYKDMKMAQLSEEPICYELKYCFDVLCRHFEEAWNKRLKDNFDIDLEDSNNPRCEIELFYLAYKSIKIAMTYPGYTDLFDRDSLLSIAVPEEMINPQRKTGKKVIGNNDLGKWIGQHNQKNIIDVVDAILENDDNHITAKIHQCLTYLLNQTYKEDIGAISIDDLLKRKPSSKAKNIVDPYSEIANLLPPAFFNVELLFKKKGTHIKENTELISFQSMSSGERQMLYMLSYIFYHIHNISTIKENGKRVVGYHHVNLVFDECELYYHPEYQRTFLRELLDKLSMCHINKTIIRSINIILVTHSPFILSDLPKDNILFLTDKTLNTTNTLGANIYDLLKDCFFLGSAIGGVVEDKLKQLLSVYNEKNAEKRRKEYNTHKHDFHFIADNLGDDYLRDTFSHIINSMDKEYDVRSVHDILLEEQAKYEEKLAEIKAKLDETEHEKD